MAETQSFIWKHIRCGTMNPGKWRDPSHCMTCRVRPVEYADEVIQYKLTVIPTRP